MGICGSHTDVGIKERPNLAYTGVVGANDSTAALGPTVNGKAASGSVPKTPPPVSSGKITTSVSKDGPTTMPVAAAPAPVVTVAPAPRVAPNATNSQAPPTPPAEVPSASSGLQPPTPDVVATAQTDDGMSTNRSSAAAHNFMILKEGEEDPKDPNNQWKKVKQLGQGGFGVVYLAKNAIGDLQAVKTITVTDEDPQALKKHYKALKRELMALKALPAHPHVVVHHKAVAESNKIHIFMEYCEGGSLRGLYLEEGALPAHRVSRYTQHILLGLTFLHESNMIHRDIKAANVLLDSEDNAKLADFGAAVVVEEQSRRTCIGTVHWMAPEVLSCRGHRWHADIWSVGCTVIELLTGQPPLIHVSRQPAKIAKFILQQFDPAVAIPESITNADARDFIQKCMQTDRDSRPTAKALLAHPFITAYAHQ